MTGYDEDRGRARMKSALGGKMRPEDFGVPMMEQAHRLLHFAIARSGGLSLDRNAAYWLIPFEHKVRLFREMEASGLIRVVGPSTDEMLGVRIRWTVGDEPSTPELQLVMEPRYERQRP